MSGRSKTVPYNWLAQYYDELFGLARFPMGRARNRILRSIFPRVHSACDLCCGTGTTALALAARGIQMFAVDLSPQMCRLARQKAVKSGLPFRVLRSDMRTFRLPQPVDLITCEFDALNHLPRRAYLAQVAFAVARALRPGGHFFFDVNNAFGFQTYWKGAHRIERPGVVLVAHSQYKPGANRATCDLEFFVREGRLWRRHTERVEEVCWSEEEIRHALMQAGLSDVSSWDAAPFFTRDSPVVPGCRTIYLARKSPDHEPQSR